MGLGPGPHGAGSRAPGAESWAQGHAISWGDGQSHGPMFSNNTFEVYVLECIGLFLECGCGRNLNIYIYIYVYMFG